MPKSWPADKVERRPIGSLIPYARNARTHSEAQVAQIAASMKEWGWTNPVLIDEGGQIIAGHGRVLAALKLGEPEVPVMVAVGWTESQKRAYVLADNQLAMNAGWNDDLLKIELQDLNSAGFPVDLIGFGNIDELLADAGNEGLTDPDAVPEVPAAPVSVLGDIWVLGKHRIACGSSTEAHVVEAVLNGVKPHLMVTDPPYGVEYDASWRERAGINLATAASGKVLNDDRADWSEAWALFPGDVAYVWHADRFSPVVAASLETNAFEMRALIIWAKSQLVMGRGHYHSQHEPCWYAVRKKAGATGHWQGDRKQTTLWTILSGDQDATTVHGTQVFRLCAPLQRN